MKVSFITFVFPLNPTRYENKDCNINSNIRTSYCMEGSYSVSLAGNKWILTIYDKNNIIVERYKIVKLPSLEKLQRTDGDNTAADFTFLRVQGSLVSVS